MKPALALQIFDPELEARLRDQMDQVEVALRGHVESEAGFMGAVFNTANCGVLSGIAEATSNDILTRQMLLYRH